MNEPITSDLIITYLKGLVESKKSVPKEEWLSCAFKLNLVRIDDAQLFNRMKQGVAQKKLDILKAQEKKNVALAEVEVESSDEYLFMKDQEAKLDAISELIRIAKKNSEENF